MNGCLKIFDFRHYASRRPPICTAQSVQGFLIIRHMIYDSLRDIDFRLPPFANRFFRTMRGQQLHTVSLCKWCLTWKAIFHYVSNIISYICLFDGSRAMRLYSHQGKAQKTRENSVQMDLANRRVKIDYSRINSFYTRHCLGTQTCELTRFSYAEVVGTRWRDSK